MSFGGESGKRQGLEHRMRQNPTDAEPCRELAKLFEAQGDLFAAARAQRQAAARKPDRPWDRFLSARLAMAAEAQRERNPKQTLPPEELEEVRLPSAEEASIELRIALELDPDFGAAFRELARLDTTRARVLKDQEQSRAAAERAISRCAEAIRLDPSDAEGHRVLGDVHFHVRGAFADARKHYLDAIAIDARNVDARAMLAATHWREGDRDTAFRELTHALSIAPDHELANEILKEIR